MLVSGDAQTTTAMHRCWPFLRPAGIEETWQIQQQQIVAAVEQGAARKAFDLLLPDLGPYRCAYSRAGRHMLLGGAKGHLAVMEWQSGHLTCEVQVNA
jgi:U3 small nucleolar RNA-associated protein 7